MMQRWPYSYICSGLQLHQLLYVATPPMVGSTVDLGGSRQQQARVLLLFLLSSLVTDTSAQYYFNHFRFPGSLDDYI